MQRIIVLNTKGGCGKTTIATNLASVYADSGLSTSLMDYDPQGSSTRWLSLRSAERPSINGIEAHKKPRGNVTRVWQNRIIPNTDRVIIDAPAGFDHNQLIEFIRQVNTVIIPVLPSPIDIHAATRFVEDLLLIAKVRQLGVRVGVVANRANMNTKIYHSLERFLKTLRLPFITTFRDTQNYVHAAERGIGIHEMWDKRAEVDKTHWQPLLEWLDEGCSDGLDTTRLRPDSMSSNSIRSNTIIPVS